MRTAGNSGQYAQYLIFSSDSTVRYIGCNPVQAGMIDHAADWRRSSARAHALGEDPECLLAMRAWRGSYHPADWQVELGAAMVDDPAIRELRDATIRGRPFGSAEFVERLERELDRVLFAKPVGRPRKRQENGISEQIWKLGFECTVPN